MKVFELNRYALSAGVAVVLLAGCALRQAQGDIPSIGAPGAVPRGSALAVRPGSSYNYKVVYSFPAGFPVAPLIDVGGKLYGTTEYGGVGSCSFQVYSFEYIGCGSVYRLTLNGHHKRLYSFASQNDGNYPVAGLTDVGGTLYGTTEYGGSYSCAFLYYLDSCGTVFSVTLSGTEKVLHNFSSADGNYPAAGLTDVNGTLYGTTQNGGAYTNKCYYGFGTGCGTVFSITPSGTEKVLHSFNGVSDGNSPAASLTEVRGKLYGTTEYGGAHDAGTVFSITLSGRVKVLHSFSGSDGANPRAGLIDVGGMLYGTTSQGGADGSDCHYGIGDGCGTVFSITRSGTEKVLHTFNGRSDGAHPSPLIEVKGKLYGTTVSGGAYGEGTVFSITPSGTEKVLYTFGAAKGDGSEPHGGLIDVNGTLYGTTIYGGAYDAGTVFALTP